MLWSTYIVSQGLGYHKIIFVCSCIKISDILAERQNGEFAMQIILISNLLVDLHIVTSDRNLISCSLFRLLCIDEFKYGSICSKVFAK